jgi:hypothetical protein
MSAYYTTVGFANPWIVTVTDHWEIAPLHDQHGSHGPQYHGGNVKKLPNRTSANRLRRAAQRSYRFARSQDATHILASIGGEKENGIDTRALRALIHSGAACSVAKQRILPASNSTP